MTVLGTDGFRPCSVIAPEEWAGAPTRRGHTVAGHLLPEPSGRSTLTLPCALDPVERLRAEEPPRAVEVEVVPWSVPPARTRAVGAARPEESGNALAARAGGPSPGERRA